MNKLLKEALEDVRARAADVLAAKIKEQKAWRRGAPSALAEMGTQHAANALLRAMTVAREAGATGEQINAARKGEP